MEKKTNKNRSVWFGLSLIVVVIAILWAGSKINFGPDYMFKGDFEGEVEEVQRCGEWRYHNLTHIPCMTSNGTIGGIMQEFLNYSLSPVQNCLQYGWSFPGFNIKNATRNFEILDQVMPICEQIHVDNITEEWLNENAECSLIKCPRFYAKAPHFPSAPFSCVKKYNIPLLSDSVEGECVEWFKEDGKLYIAKQ